MKINELLVNGGMAHGDAVSFYGKNYQSRAKRNKTGEISVEIQKLNSLPNWLNNMLLIPVLRGFADTIYAFYMKWWVGLLFLVAPIAMNYRIQAVMGLFTSQSGNAEAGFIFGMLTGLIMVTIVLKLTPTGKYHAAEHIVHNLYLQGRPLNVEEGKNTSRIHEWCGTGCIFLLITYTVIMVFIPIATWLKIILWFPFYGEVIMNQNKYFRMVVTPFKWITYASQFLTTSKPKEEHIEASLKAFQSLLEKEEEMRKSKTIA
ncbi:Uncharacterized conserved protein YqhQ [Terribacillus halophilus]|uniref:Uncharacterized conserved protein YqhQ n=1 Tax=Terribacillus halophilus TaxID=361279 RepID=A0A1G6NNQ0_9BACI|nr:DUF1385 domain-containing protein [Terribacillus halophilus]SDC69580.1 Uncharacterized conserved protein YqhQ [Terribacillus halophilus]